MNTTMELVRTITSQGKTLHLEGRRIKVGEVAPNFRVTGAQLQEIRLSDFAGRIKLLTSFPSLDTSTCQLQVREFNQRATALNKDIVLLGVSQDLPFAQARFCEMNNIKNVLVASDYRLSSFALNYGLLIKELGLLARTVLIVDKNNILRYMQIVPELSQEPDYDAAMRELQKVADQPVMAGNPIPDEQCQPCKAGTPPLTEKEIQQLLDPAAGWEVEKGKALRKEFKFKDFNEAKHFLDWVALVAEEQGHHPDISLLYNKLTFTLTTHTCKGLTKNDFIMARLIDKLKAGAA